MTSNGLGQEFVVLSIARKDQPDVGVPWGFQVPVRLAGLRAGQKAFASGHGPLRQPGAHEQHQLLSGAAKRQERPPAATTRAVFPVVFQRR